MRYLLDTNTLIHVMRGTTSMIDAMAKKNRGDIAVSSITCYELYTGVEKCLDPPRERRKVDTLLGAVQQLFFDWSAAMHAAAIRAALESRGEMIGPYDVLIAGHALSLNLTLVTANTNEFQRVPGLAIENWNQ